MSEEMVWVRPLWRLDAGCIEVRVKRWWWTHATQQRRGVVMTDNKCRYCYYAYGAGLALLLLAYFFLVAAKASAQDGDARWFLRPLAQQCLDDSDCRSRLRRPRRHHHHHYVAPSRNHRYELPERAPRVYGYERRDHRDEPRRQVMRCKGVMEARGAEAITSEGALRLANRAWQAAVRADHGERHMEIKHAGDYRFSCFRSSTNESTAGKLMEWSVGGIKMRCQVWARPCQAPVLEGLPEKGEVRKELEEEGAQPGPNSPPAQFERVR